MPPDGMGKLLEDCMRQAREKLKPVTLLKITILGDAGIPYSP
jgi:hypothetical protein